jgi:hypothetical protein
MEVDAGERLLVSVVIELSANDVAMSDPAKQTDDEGSAGEHSENPGVCARMNPLEAVEHSDSAV